MDICGITQWVLSRFKGSIYPVYIGYIPKPVCEDLLLAKLTPNRRRFKLPLNLK